MGSFVTKLNLTIFLFGGYYIFGSNDERWCMDLLGKRIYLQPMGMVLDTINDIVELQNGKLTYSDTLHGKINFRVKMYAFKWEFSFTVTDIGKNRSQVQIEIDGDTQSKEKQILREFALLDSMLIIGAQIEIPQS